MPTILVIDVRNVEMKIKKNVKKRKKRGENKKKTFVNVG